MIIDHIIDKADNAKALFIFAHGAGAGMGHDFMQQISQLLVAQGISVLRFNFPYMEKALALGKRHPPDVMAKLIDCYQGVIKQQETDLPLYIGGKSMGGRVAAMLAALPQAKEQPQTPLAIVRGVVCLGYPFHPDKKPQKLRLAPLQQARLPILIVQGDRDTMGSQQEIAEYDISSLCQCYFVEDGDHSFKPRVKSGFNQQQHLHTAALQIVRFIDENN
jgi:predicted alpha/beta-hydrolase family hydrolase